MKATNSNDRQAGATRPVTDESLAEFLRTLPSEAPVGRSVASNEEFALAEMVSREIPRGVISLAESGLIKDTGAK